MAIELRSVDLPDFGTPDRQPVIAPAQGRRPHFEARGGLAQGRAAAICHGKAAAGAIGGDIDTDVIVGVAAPGPAIPGRKHRAYEGNDRYSAGGIGVYAVDVPPSVAIGWDREAEMRSFKIASTACRAEVAAIGIPAPG